MSEEARSNPAQSIPEQSVQAGNEAVNTPPTQESTPFHKIVGRGIHKIVRALMPPLR